MLFTSFAAGLCHYLTATDRTILCTNNFGMVTSINMWIEYIVLAPLVAFTTTAVNTEIVQSAAHWNIFFGLMVCNIFGLLMQQSISKKLEIIYFVLSCLSYAWTMVMCFEFKNIKSRTDSSNPSTFDIYHNSQFDMEWRVVRDNITFLLFVIMPSFPIIYLLAMQGIIDSDQAAIAFGLTSLCSKLGYLTTLLDTLMTLFDNLAFVKVANAISAANRKSIMNFVFHEVKNPLNSLSIGILAVLRDMDESDDNKEVLALMSQSVDTINDTLTDAFALQLIEEKKFVLKKSSFHLHDALHSVCRKVQRSFDTAGAKKKLAININPDVPSKVIGDMARFLTTFHYYLSYTALVIAFDCLFFSIGVTVRSMMPTSEDIMVMVMIDDDGVGLEADVVLASMQPFSQLRVHQSGDSPRNFSSLSFALARELIELHGGEVLLLPAPSTPSKLKIGFTIRFGTVDTPADVDGDRDSDHIIDDVTEDVPRLLESESALAGTTAMETITDSSASMQLPSNTADIDDVHATYIADASHHMADQLTAKENLSNVLIVDDVAVNTKILSILLSKKSTICDTASNGLLAVEAVRADIAHYQLIFMDITMPVMDGISATQEIRALGFRGFIIGLTGNLLREDIRGMLDAGADMVLAKPFRPHDCDMLISFLRGCGYKSCYTTARLIMMNYYIEVCRLDRPGEVRDDVLSCANEGYCSVSALPDAETHVECPEVGLELVSTKTINSFAAKTSKLEE